MSDPNSMLAKMFDPDSAFSAPGVKKDGAYFIDRDPLLFGPVLNYLRSGHLEKDCNVPALLKEANYFGLLGLEAALQEVAKEQANAKKEEAKAKEEPEAGTGDIFLLNVGGEIFATSKTTLCWHLWGNSKLAKMVRGEDEEEEEEFDKDGNLFLDFDPKDFSYVLKALRKRGKGEYRSELPEEAYYDVMDLAARLDLRSKISSFSVFPSFPFTIQVLFLSRYLCIQSSTGPTRP